MTDYIDRQAAIDAINRAVTKEVARWSVEELPPAEVEPVKHGRWIHDYDDVLISGACSVCGWHSIIMETDVADMPYCPSCGAKMEPISVSPENGQEV